MSDIIWQSEDGTLAVSQFCGPEGPPDRRMWQFTVRGVSAALSPTELHDLLATLKRELER